VPTSNIQHLSNIEGHPEAQPEESGTGVQTLDILGNSSTLLSAVQASTIPIGVSRDGEANHLELNMLVAIDWESRGQFRKALHQAILEEDANPFGPSQTGAVAPAK